MRRSLCQSVSLCVVLAVSFPAIRATAEEPYGRHQFEPAARDHWSFQPLVRPDVPAPKDRVRAENPIDAFVLAGLERAGLAPAPPADRATLLRRVYLDLIGLPPTLDELDAFLANASATAFENVVDDLLARPQYGERWARHWLDVVRYAETNGYERDGLKPQAWRYRDWVIDALNADQRYDQFLTDQLAGDELPGASATTQIGTTMLRLGPWDDEPADPLVDRYDQLDDIVATTAAAFMGLTLRCARCHDHKFEPFTQKDYARWQAVFAPLKRPQQDRADLDREVGPPAEVAAYLATLKSLDAQGARLREELTALEWQICKSAAAEGRLAASAEAPPATAPAAAATAQAAKSQPAVDKTAGEASARASRGLPADVLAALAIEPAKRNDAQKKLLTKHRSQLSAVARELANDMQRERLDALGSEIQSNKDHYPPPMTRAYVWHEEGPTFGASHIFRRGDPRAAGEEVLSGFPAVLVDRPPGPPSPTAYSTGRRLQLARWLTSSDHPLTARVMVNRLWQHHFGDGIVATENDFGVMGAAPSDQALLDWLASEFVAGGWRIKRMHRLMVLSETYRMASIRNSSATETDSDEPLGWRFRPRRLEAEALRDAILASSGQLNLAAGGPGVFPKISREVLETQSRPGDGWKASDPFQAARRSVYVFVKRTLSVPEFEVLDFPSTEESCEQRVVSTVAPQALTFLNGEFIHEQAHAFAQRLMREAGGNNADRVVRAYRLALARLPSDRELAAVLVFLAAQQTQISFDSKEPLSAETAQLKALAAFCLVLLNSNEFAYLQ